MSDNIILNGKCVYTPKGAAREYAAVGCNFYRGCPYQCRYCYNRKGLTAAVMGVDHAVLESMFTNLKVRPKKYSELSAEDYAFCCFCQEVDKNVDYLRKTGIFFSFSTDPLCSDAFDLTLRAVFYAVHYQQIPVKILTKNADYTALQMLKFEMLNKDDRQLIAVGFTLTGRDDWEPYASKNIERVRMMNIFKKMGFRTFASIEPVVDFKSSKAMIKKSLPFCDQYLIGLMSKRGKELPPYSSEECSDFVFDVDNMLLSAYSSKKTKRLVHIYWKESLRKLMKDEAFAMQIINNSPASVNSEWSVFSLKKKEIIHEEG